MSNYIIENKGFNLEFLSKPVFWITKDWEHCLKGYFLQTTESSDYNINMFLRVRGHSICLLIDFSADQKISRNKDTSYKTVIYRQ